MIGPQLAPDLAVTAGDLVIHQRGRPEWYLVRSGRFALPIPRLIPGEDFGIEFIRRQRTEIAPELQTDEPQREGTTAEEPVFGTGVRTPLDTTPPQR